MDATLVELVSGYGLLEGSRWYPSLGLVFSDMTKGGVYALDADDRPQPLIEHRKGIGGLVAHAAGGLVISGRNVAHRRLGHDAAAATILLEPQADEQFFNDLTSDAAGRVYAGSVGKVGTAGGPPSDGRLYRIEVDGRVDVLSDDVLVSNGLGVDPTSRYLYHVDSNRHLLWRFDLRSPDPASTRTRFVDTSEYGGVPDGLCVATDGSVWVAMAGGGVVVSWDGDGHRIGELAVPQSLVTSVSFGGPDRTTLYVLTGCNDDHPDEHGGAVYRTEVAVSGLPAPFAAVLAPSPSPS